MQFSSFKQNKPASHSCLISASLILLLFITPALAFAEDDTGIDTLRQMGKAFAEIAEKASPAVVGIKASKTVTMDYPTMREGPFGEPFDPFEDDLFDYFFRRRSPRQRSPQPKSYQLAQGSGFIVSPDGYILTANHLVGEAEEIMVRLADDREFDAKIIGTDPDSDVAVVKIDAKDLPSLEFADSDALEVGEWVLAIGNPFGLSHTITAGIVSAKGRSGFRLAAYENYIQTDAAINPGNSGGPLINVDGKVVGINTAIVTGHLAYRGNVGIGFAIPINMAKSIYDQLVESGTVVRGFLGVGIQDLTHEFAAAFDLKEGTKGVLVPEVTEDSAADKAGLKHNDVIVEFNGQPVETAKVLQNRVAMLRPGTKVKVVVLRDGKRETLTVELGKRPSMGEIVGARPETLDELGFSVRDLTDDLAERYGYEGLTGVVVTKVEPGSQAARTGITRGMLIKEVDRRQVRNTKEFNEAIEKARKKGSVLLLIKQERYTLYFLLQLPKK